MTNVKTGPSDPSAEQGTKAPSEPNGFDGVGNTMTTGFEQIPVKSTGSGFAHVSSGQPPYAQDVLPGSMPAETSIVHGIPRRPDEEVVVALGPPPAASATPRTSTPPPLAPKLEEQHAGKKNGVAVAITRAPRAQIADIPPTGAVPLDPAALSDTPPAHPRIKSQPRPLAIVPRAWAAPAVVEDEPITITQKVLVALSRAKEKLADVAFNIWDGEARKRFDRTEKELRMSFEEQVGDVRKDTEGKHTLQQYNLKRLSDRIDGELTKLREGSQMLSMELEEAQKRFIPIPKGQLVTPIVFNKLIAALEESKRNRDDAIKVVEDFKIRYNEDVMVEAIAKRAFQNVLGMSREDIQKMIMTELGQLKSGFIEDFLRQFDLYRKGWGDELEGHKALVHEAKTAAEKVVDHCDATVETAKVEQEKLKAEQQKLEMMKREIQDSMKQLMEFQDKLIELRDGIEQRLHMLPAPASTDEDVGNVFTSALPPTTIAPTNQNLGTDKFAMEAEPTRERPIKQEQLTGADTEAHVPVEEATQIVQRPKRPQPAEDPLLAAVRPWTMPRWAKFAAAPALVAASVLGYVVIGERTPHAEVAEVKTTPALQKPEPQQEEKPVEQQRDTEKRCEDPARTRECRMIDGEEMCRCVRTHPEQQPEPQTRQKSRKTEKKEKPSGGKVQKMGNLGQQFQELEKEEREYYEELAHPTPPVIKPLKAP